MGLKKDRIFKMTVIFQGYYLGLFIYFLQAKTEKLKPLEVELRRLEDLSDSIVNGIFQNFVRKL